MPNKTKNLKGWLHLYTLPVQFLSFGRKKKQQVIHLFMFTLFFNTLSPENLLLVIMKNPKSLSNVWWYQLPLAKIINIACKKDGPGRGLKE